MGGLFSFESNRNPLLNADRNNDGIISRHEFDIFMTRQKNFQDSFEEKIRSLQKTVDNKESELDSLTKDLKKELEQNKSEASELEFLRNRVKVLEEEKEFDLNRKPILLPNVKKVNKVSRAKVKLFVHELMKDSDINIKYFPDNVEKALYENMFCLILNVLENVTDTSGIEILGHILKLKWE